MTDPMLSKLISLHEAGDIQGYNDLFMSLCVETQPLVSEFCKEWGVRGRVGPPR